ncbi:MAG: hypothetical protein PHH49_06125 [Candidatus Omnitrophica bacterium]|nr:hypothetical protein [Candidatus Omnitrophota bacterium]MDD5488517.1 hypothetical protein [Candidatus Omnitrophota bacterium]
MSFFEILMLVCFGAAWPFSIAKSYRSMSTEGKSLVFLVIVLVGYVAGLLHKVFYDMNAVIILYAANALMVSLDICIFLRNRRVGKKHTC